MYFVYIFFLNTNAVMGVFKRPTMSWKWILEMKAAVLNRETQLSIMVWQPPPPLILLPKKTKQKLTKQDILLETHKHTHHHHILPK